jgi:hypothetical protein
MDTLITSKSSRQTIDCQWFGPTGHLEQASLWGNLIRLLAPSHRIRINSGGKLAKKKFQMVAIQKRF